MRESYNFMPMILMFLIISIVWGRVILFSVDKRYFRKIVFFLMKYIPAEFALVESLLLGILYILSFILGVIVVSIVYNFNILDYILIDIRYAPYFLVGIMAEFSLSGIIMAIMLALVPKVNWVEEIQSIPWIESISYVPNNLGWIIPLVGAFCEETFYRGVVYILLRTVFPSLGIIIPIIISAVLFSIQQMLNTNTLNQCITMAIGSIAISIIGCLLVELTGSFLPALVAHESFVIFYFKQLDNDLELS